MARTKFPYLFFFFCLTFTFYFCQAQTGDKIHLSKIIFHSSRCNGTCPSIDLEIDCNRNIFIKREYYKTKSKIDERFSGQFSGVLDQDKYNKLIELLQNSNLDTLQFPDITCCDAPITTLIIYYNGQRKYLNSMTPPEIVNELILFLKTISDDKELIKTTMTRTIEK